MRVLHTADWHLGKTLEGQSRLEEQALFLRDFVRMAEDERADVIVIAGDIYDSVNPPAKAEMLFYDTLKKLSPKGERLIIVIAGNHDNPERLVAAGPLAMEHGIIMAGLPGTVIRLGKYGKHRITESGAGYFKAEVACADGVKERLVCTLVPYPSEKRLAEVLYEEQEDEKKDAEDYAARLDRMFRMLEVHFEEQSVNLMCAHLFAMGSISAGSERSLSLGNSYLIDGALFPKKADYIALGHIHKPQKVLHTGGRARYAGAPLHYHKNEAAYKNVCLLAELHPGQKPQITSVSVPVYKPIEIWRCDGVEDALKKCEAHHEDASYVYLEIETDRYIREDEMKEMKQWKQDIMEIKPILKKTDTKENGSKAVAEQSMEELFRNFYRQEKGTEVSEETLKLFLEIAGEEQELEAD